MNAQCGRDPLVGVSPARVILVAHQQHARVQDPFRLVRPVAGERLQTLALLGGQTNTMLARAVHGHLRSVKGPERNIGTNPADPSI